MNEAVYGRRAAEQTSGHDERRENRRQQYQVERRTSSASNARYTYLGYHNVDIEAMHEQRRRHRDFLDDWVDRNFDNEIWRREFRRRNRRRRHHSHTVVSNNWSADDASSHRA